jgi:NADH-quinone oxidoreductase subunit M
VIPIILVTLPLLAALAALWAGGAARRVALWASIVEFCVVAVAWSNLGLEGGAPLAVDLAWIPSMGIRFSLGLDGVSLLMVLLTGLLLPLIILSGEQRAASEQSDRKGIFYALILATQAALMGVFMARDGFLFYVCWELALIPVWFLCLVWGSSPDRGRIALKFFVYTLFGSLFMLAALVFVYLHTGGEDAAPSFAIDAMYKAGRALTAGQQKWVFAGLFLGLAIKMPLFPFHTWQPDTYVSAPTEGSMLLSGLLLKMGTFGLIRWLVPMTPTALHDWGQVAVALSVIGVVYASCLALVQTDFKRLIAYSSIAHVGLIAAGVLAVPVAVGGVIPEQGMVGALVQMLSHGVTVVGLFFVADYIELRTGTRELGQLGGLRHKAPLFAWFFLTILLGSIALPLTSGFVGEFLLIVGVFQYNVWLAAVSGLTIILGATYMLRSYQAAMLGEEKRSLAGFLPMKGADVAFLVPCAALVIALGVFPKPILDLVQPDVKQVLNSLVDQFQE